MTDLEQQTRPSEIAGKLGASEIASLAREIGAEPIATVDGEAFGEEWCRRLARVVEGSAVFPHCSRYPDRIAGWCHSLQVASPGHMRLEMRRIRAEISAIDWDDGWATDRAGSAVENICLAMQPGTRWLAHAAQHVWAFATGSNAYNDVVKISRDAWLRAEFLAVAAILARRNQPAPPPLAAQPGETKAARDPVEEIAKAMCRHHFGMAWHHAEKVSRDEMRQAVRDMLAALAKSRPDREAMALREALNVAKRAILKAAKDTLWCDDRPAETVIDRIDAVLAEADGQQSLALPSGDGAREADSLSWWIADIQRRADICKSEYEAAGAPSIDRCELPEGSRHLFAYFAFDRLAKDMRAALDPQDGGGVPAPLAAPPPAR